ncbi:MAG: MarR family transcriptional regulator [Candidatus Omnitrophica bacterium]|nr:MarR family transcriptional regulator [Candidatus Omnitrophota bacterium]
MALALPEFADELNRLIPFLLKEMVRRNTKEHFKERITLPQLLVMQFMDENQSSRMTDVATFMKVSTAAITGLVDRLVRSGYAARLLDSNDRRIIRVNLTAKGRGLIKKINDQRRQMVVHIFGKISEQEREDYLRILRRIRDVLVSEKE